MIQKAVQGIFLNVKYLRIFHDKYMVGEEHNKWS